jgi:hypothetical protein
MPEAMAVLLAWCAGTRETLGSPTGEHQDIGLFAAVWTWALAHPVAACGVGLGLVSVSWAQHQSRQHPAPADDPAIGCLVLGGSLLIIMGLWFASVGVW